MSLSQSKIRPQRGLQKGSHRELPVRGPTEGPQRGLHRALQRLSPERPHRRPPESAPARLHKHIINRLHRGPESRIGMPL